MGWVQYSWSGTTVWGQMPLGCSHYTYCRLIGRYIYIAHFITSTWLNLHHPSGKPLDLQMIFHLLNLWLPLMHQAAINTSVEHIFGLQRRHYFFHKISSPTFWIPLSGQFCLMLERTVAHLWPCADRPTSSSTMTAGYCLCALQEELANVKDVWMRCWGLSDGICGDLMRAKYGPIMLIK